MSVSTKLTTFRQMEDAVVHSASSEAAAHPSGNLVSVEPNFYWESDQSSYQHQIVIDLGKPCKSNIVVVATSNVEDETALDGVDITLSHGNDGAAFTEVSNAVDPGIMEGSVLKPFRFDLTGQGYRYWKVVVSGYGSPDYYPPDPTRLSGIWVGRERGLSMPHAWPADDSETYPSDSLELPFGMRFGIGRNLRSHTAFSRRYLLIDSDYDDFSSSLSDSGTGTPIVLQEGDDSLALVRMVGDIREQMIYDGAYIVSVRYVKLPLLPAGKAY